MKKIIIAFVLFFTLNSLCVNAKDFEIKAFHVDLRAQVMTMDALMKLADKLSGIGVNTIIMEWEAAFPYDKHATLSNKYAYKPHQIKGFIDHCKNLNIDVIPLQNCFGHVEYILRHDRYSRLREDAKEISQVCPMQEKLNKQIFTEIFTEMASMHPSKYFHIGGDETRLLGNCKRCAAKVQTEGKSKLFVDYVKIMCDIVTSMGKIPVLWADIILKYPESADLLPKEAVFIDWNYGWKKDKFGDTENLLKHGFEFWGAPSLRSAPDNIYLTQWNKHFDNISTFIPDCRNAGYNGIVMTSWSTSGQYGFSYDVGWEVTNMYPIRYVYPLSGFDILIAAFGEALKSNESLAIPKFIVEYAQQQFGLNQAEGEALGNILLTRQNNVRYGRDSERTDITKLIEENKLMLSQLASMKPKKNKSEFEHIRLMFDFRLQYLTFRELENRYQSNDFSRKDAGELLKELKNLKKIAGNNDKRFIKLNKGYLHIDEMLEINRVRNEKLDFIYAGVNNMIN